MTSSEIRDHAEGSQSQVAVPLLLVPRDRDRLEYPVRVQFGVYVVRHRSDCHHPNDF